MTKPTKGESLVLTNQLIPLLWPRLDEGFDKSYLRDIFENVLESWEPTESVEKEGHRRDY